MYHRDGEFDTFSACGWKTRLPIYFGGLEKKMYLRAIKPKTKAERR